MSMAAKSKQHNNKESKDEVAVEEEVRRAFEIRDIPQ